MLLQDGVFQNHVLPTEYTKKLTIDGHTDTYQVYKIRIDQLYYNDQNDRIATWISKYKAENNIDKINILDEQYNNLIEPFIYESNPKAIDKTKKNIELVGQREPGVVLNDGRVIDGNRRLTCLRKIEKERTATQYFEAVILERDIESSEKEIKLLELSIQHGEEGKVDYNPIDKLVGIYNDVIKNKLITEDEYRSTVNETKSAINKKIEQAKLMVEFLDFINASERYYIARDLELDGPLGEISHILNKLKTDNEREQLKRIIFCNLIIKPQGDITRFIRKMGKIVDSDYNEDFIAEQMDFVDRTLEKIGDMPKVDSQYINKVFREDDDMKSSMKSSVEKFEVKVKKNATRMKPVDDLLKCRLILEGIDIRMVEMLDASQKLRFEENVLECEELINKIKVTACNC